MHCGDLPRLLVFDLDGTLVSEGADQVALDVVSALQRWREAGVASMILTARDQIPTPILEQVQPTFTGVMNGALICRGEQVIAENALSPDDLRATLNHSLHDAQVIISARDGVLAALSEAQQNSIQIKEWLGRHGIQLYRGQAVTALKVRFVHRNVAAHARTLRTVPTLTVTGGIPPYLDSLVVTAAAANKGAALRRIAQTLQIDLGEVMAFGDSDNDQAMLSVAGRGVRIGHHPQLIPVSQTGLDDRDQLGGYLHSLLETLGLNTSRTQSPCRVRPV